MDSEIKSIIEKLRKFRDDRNWKQFHNSKDIAIAISIECSELLELFLWKGNEDFDQEELEDELADILSFCFLLADKHDIDVRRIITKKIKKNESKYPVSKAKGSSKKYDKL